MRPLCLLNLKREINSYLKGVRAREDTRKLYVDHHNNACSTFSSTPIVCASRWRLYQCRWWAKRFNNHLSCTQTHTHILPTHFGNTLYPTYTYKTCSHLIYFMNLKLILDRRKDALLNAALNHLQFDYGGMGKWWGVGWRLSKRLGIMLYLV